MSYSLLSKETNKTSRFLKNMWENKNDPFFLSNSILTYTVFIFSIYYLFMAHDPELHHIYVHK